MDEFTAIPVALDELHESPWNPRKHFPQASLENLAQSMREVGPLAPLLVRPWPAGGYEIASGHRRRRAAVLAKLTNVPVIVKQLTDQQLLEILTIENLQREDVHALDEGEGYRTLMKQAGYSIETVAAKIGKSASYVYQRLKLAEMIPKAKEAFLADKISTGHAILIARLQPKDQEEALKTCMQLGDMSVRHLAQWIEQNVHLDLSSAPWDKAAPALLPPAGACTTCPKRTGFVPELFPDIKKKDTCTDRGCFQAKTNAYAEQIRKQLEAKGEKLLDLSGEWHHYNKSDRGVPKQEWCEKVKAGSCPSTRMGIVINQGGEHRIGEVFPVCVDRKCRIHHPDREFRLHRGNSYVPSPGKEIAKRLHVAIREKVKAPLPRAMLEVVAGRFFDDIWHELRVEIVKVWGWADAKKARSLAYGRTLTAHLPKMSQDDLARLLVDLAVSRELHGSTYTPPGQVNPLRAAAKIYGVNEAKIQAAVRKELAEKLKVKKDREKKAKAQAKPATKEKAAMKSYPEPTCVQCGCTEAAPCPGGCSWAKLDKKTNAGLCSACSRKAVIKAQRGAGMRVHTSAKSKA